MTLKLKWKLNSNSVAAYELDGIILVYFLKKIKQLNLWKTKNKKFI